jgi:hypothetical protein
VRGQLQGASLKRNLSQKHFLAATVLLGSLAVTASAYAVDGCEVLLCLASPGGWNKIAQCEPPMRELLKSLAEGHSFPSCQLAGDPKSKTGSFAAAMQSNYYSQCPAGTAPLPSGSFAIMAPSWTSADNTPAWLKEQSIYAGIGDGSGLDPASGATVSSLPPLVCVSGPPLGQVRYTSPINPAAPVPGAALGVSVGVAPTINVYSSVTILQPNTSSNVIGVWIDGALYNQVHW